MNDPTVEQMVERAQQIQAAGAEARQSLTEAAPKALASGGVGLVVLFGLIYWFLVKQ